VAAWAADADAAAHVIVDALDDELVIEGDDGHHLARVRRLRPAEAVTAADGNGAWRLYVVTDVSGRRLHLEARGSIEREPELQPQLTVAFALTKGAKPEQVVRQLTELGVDRMIPLQTRRAVVRWDEARASVAVARLAGVARAAAMQCRRARVPPVDAITPLEQVAARRGLVVADRAGEPSAALPAASPAGWLLVVGPEGGFAEDERALVAGAPRLGVGPHVLRAETAAVAAAALLVAARRPA